MPQGQAIAFVGRVPVKVKGKVEKGEKVYAMDYGIATTTQKRTIGRFCFRNNADELQKLVEVALRLINN